MAARGADTPLGFCGEAMLTSLVLGERLAPIMPGSRR